MKKYNLNLTEFEILTLRESLFLFKKYNSDELTEEEFIKIDNKIKEVFK